LNRRPGVASFVNHNQNRSSLLTRNQIDQGATSVVFSAIHRDSGRDYSVKVMSSSDFEDRNTIHKVEREFNILENLCHEHIIQFYEVFPVNNLIFLVIEQCDGGDFFHNRLTLKWLFHEVSFALQYLHREGIAHNDIKPENAMPDRSGHVKPIDFGFAKCSSMAGDGGKSGTLIYIPLKY
jgi:serine/threonine protein kinase